MTTHVVKRPLPTRQGLLQPGATVDASGWRNAPHLERTGFLERLSGDPAKGDEGKGDRKGGRR